MFSVTEENYIKSIYQLQSKEKKVNTNDLARSLQTKSASITDMLKKLKAKKILHYEKYYGFRLNDTGCKIALHIIRRHRLWEYFLVEKLKLNWDKVHLIAEELEHVSSNELIEQLDKFLGCPEFDPHGDPIPDVNGKMPVVKQSDLYNAGLQKKVIVSSVGNQSHHMLELLSHYGITIGTKLTVKRIFEFDKSVEVKIARHPVFLLSEPVAKNIFVYHD